MASAAEKLATEIRDRCEYWLGVSLTQTRDENTLARVRAELALDRDDFEGDLEFLLDLSTEALAEL